MITKLAIKNILQQKTRTLLTSIGVIIGVTSLFLFLSLSQGLTNNLENTLSKRNPLNQIRVTNNPLSSSTFKLLNSNQSKLMTPEVVETIKNIPGVESVQPQISYVSPISSISINLFGLNLESDTKIFGVPYELIKDDISPNTEWKVNGNKVPILASTQLLDLYNLLIAPETGLPSVTKEDLKDITFEIYLNNSTFFPFFNNKEKPLEGYIVGFSDKVSIVGLTMPIDAIRQFNQQNKENYQETYGQLYVYTQSPQDVLDVSNTIEEKLELETSHLQKEITGFDSLITFFTIGLSTISVLILIVSTLGITNTYLSAVNERTKEIGILRALGAKKKHIRQMFLTESSILGLLNGIIGSLIGLLTTFIIDYFAIPLIPNLSIKPETLFSLTPNLFIVCITTSILISIIATLVPANKAANLAPVKALNR